MATGGIYIIRLSDTHYYGGRTKCFRSRWVQHLKDLREGEHSNSRMQNVFNLFGVFQPEVVQEIEDLTLQIRAEQEWLAQHFRKEGCVNLSASAHGAVKVGGSTRARLSIAKRRENLSAETREKLSRAMRGKRLSSETRAKIAAARASQVFPEESREKWRAARLGYRHSAETREKISSSQIGKKMSEASVAKANAARKANFTGETRERMSIAQKGKKASPETRERMAAAQRARRLREAQGGS